MEPIGVGCASISIFKCNWRLLRLGLLVRTKNQLFSLEVLIELKKLHGNAKLNLVGVNGITPYYRKLIDFVNNNGLEDSVNFIVKTDDVEKIYEHTSFAIIHSLREGFSLVAIEAQAYVIEMFASSNIPKEVVCGGVVFFDLLEGAKYWADEIDKYYLRYGNNRHGFDTKGFGFEKYKYRLAYLYGFIK